MEDGRCKDREGPTGWFDLAEGRKAAPQVSLAQDAESLYEALPAWSSTLLPRSCPSETRVSIWVFKGRVNMQTVPVGEGKREEVREGRFAPSGPNTRWREDERPDKDRTLMRKGRDPATAINEKRALTSGNGHFPHTIEVYHRTFQED